MTQFDGPVSVWFSRKVYEATQAILDDGTPYKIGMVTMVPTRVRGPWWRFWQPWSTMVEIRSQTMSATLVREDRHLFRFAPEAGKHWTWREGEKFVEFVLWNASGIEIMRGGTLSAKATVGDIVEPNIYIDLDHMFRGVAE